MPRPSAVRIARKRSSRNGVVRIAHDFNNVLMAILGHCDLLERGAEGSTDAVREIRAAAETAAGLTRELIAVDKYARTRAARRTPNDRDS
jgi:signal transduction histidine kinase